MPRISVEEQMMWGRWWKSRDISAKRCLMIRHEGLVYHNARIWGKQLHGRCEMEDVLQAMRLGLSTAIDTYDPNAGCVFATHATWKMRAEMRNLGRSVDTVPEHYRAQIRRGEGEEFKPLSWHDPRVRFDVEHTASDSPDPLRVLLNNVETDWLWRSVAKLPERQATMMRMRYRDEMKFSQIAKHLGIGAAGLHKMHKLTIARLRRMALPMIEEAA